MNATNPNLDSSAKKSRLRPIGTKRPHTASCGSLALPATNSYTRPCKQIHSNRSPVHWPNKPNITSLAVISSRGHVGKNLRLRLHTPKKATAPYQNSTSVVARRKLGLRHHRQSGTRESVLPFEPFCMKMPRKTSLACNVAQHCHSRISLTKDDNVLLHRDRSRRERRFRAEGCCG